MRILKKHICFLLSICILGAASAGVGIFNTTEVFAEELPKTHQIEFLELINVIEPMNSDNYTANVTREDFAYYTAKAAGIDASGYKDIRWYTDISKDSYAFASVNALCERGILSPGEDNKFRPKDFITYAEAYTMLLNAMGYKELASAYGQWPIGYNRIARSLNINRGELYDLISFEDCCALIYDAVSAPMYDITGVGEDGTGYTSSDETLLSTVFSIKTGEGSVECVYGGSLSTQKILEDNRIVVSGNEYKVVSGLNVRNYIGNYVEYFYYDKNFEKSVMFLNDNIQRLESITFDIEDFEKIEDSKIVFITEDSKEKKYSLSNEKVILYNGMPLSRMIDETLNNLNKGYIVLKDSDNDGIYDVVDITDYKNLVVRGYNENTETIQDKIKTDYSVKLADKAYVGIEADGEEIDRSVFVSDVVLSVAESINGEVIK